MQPAVSKRHMPTTTGRVLWARCCRLMERSTTPMVRRSELLPTKGIRRRVWRTPSWTGEISGFCGDACWAASAAVPETHELAIAHAQNLILSSVRQSYLARVS